MLLESAMNSPQHSIIVKLALNRTTERKMLPFLMALSNLFFFFLGSKFFTNYYRKLDEQNFSLFSLKDILTR